MRSTVINLALVTTALVAMPLPAQRVFPGGPAFPAGDTAIVIKGEGGEIEVNPDGVAHLYGTQAGESWDEDWPALSPQRHVKPAQLDPQHLLAVWRGEAEDAYGELAVVATMALALRGLGHLRENAFIQARQYWERRNLSV